MKKIAIIGCSHFASFQRGAGESKDSWPWLMANKFPQHQYRNYSEGGRGMEYFQWCLIDAFDWGADIVFMNKTYTGRYNILGMFDEFAPTKLNWNTKMVSDKPHFEERHFETAYAWISGGQGHVNGSGPTFVIKEMEQALDTLAKYCLGTEVRNSYEEYWYTAQTKMNKFENFFLVQWGGDFFNGTNLDQKNFIGNVNKESVVSFMCNRFDIENEFHLYTNGITKSENDNHLTRKGAEVLLNEYLLMDENVKKALT